MKPKRAIALIQQYAKRWTYRLGLRWWKIDLEFMDDPDSILAEFARDENKTCLATTYTEWCYTAAHICFNVPAWCKLDEGEFERMLLHELCHILVNEMREGEMHHEERVVSHLQRAFMWTEVDVTSPEKRDEP